LLFYISCRPKIPAKGWQKETWGKYMMKNFAISIFLLILFWQNNQGSSVSHAWKGREIHIKF
jgi:hypothetical protein